MSDHQGLETLDRAAPAWQHDPAWAHSDLLPGNLLVRDGRLAAVIDFGAAGVGDPCYDLTVAWNSLPVRGHGDGSGTRSAWTTPRGRAPGGGR